jgi:membrane dipeptidase
MPKLEWIDHAADPAAWARAQGVSVEAVELLIRSPFIDLHLDLEVPVRLFGYRPERRHGPWRRVMPLMFHTDYPRLREARLTGVVYDLATNIFRTERGRMVITEANLARCVDQIEAWPDDLGVARSRADYDRLVGEGKTAFFLALQGGNALSLDPGVLDGPIGRELHRITLVHLKSSVLGGSNSPRQPDEGITARGRELVDAAVRNQVIVDLAHAGPRTFWTTLDAVDRSVPVIVSHTGMNSVRPLWRNIDDAAARAIGDRGGVVGVIYNGGFLDRVMPGRSCARARILDHLQAIIDAAGEGVAAIGTDYDGVITPPWDLPDITDHPKLVQDMLDRGWSPERVTGILGGNYLRVVAAIRPETPPPRAPRPLLRG